MSGETSQSTGVGDERESPVRAVVVAVALGVGGVLLAIPAVVPVLLLVGLVAVPVEVAILLALIASQYVAFGGLALGYLRRRGMGWTEIRSYLGVRVPTIRELLVVVGGWVLIYGLLVVVGLFVRSTGVETGENQAVEIVRQLPRIVPVMVAGMLLIVGPSEELLYRGVVQNRLREAFGPAPSILIATAVFAVVHLGALTGGLDARLATVAILFVPGLVFGVVYEYTGNLVVPALLHGVHNAVIVLALYVQLTSEVGPETALLAVAGWLPV